MGKISYYELLGMIKDGNIPKRLYVKLPSINYGVHYIAEYNYGNFSYYYKEETKEDDVNYRNYLGECFLESDMFKKCIHILDEEEFEDIEEIEIIEYFNDISNRKLLELHSEEMVKAKIKINQLIKNQKKIIQKLNENK